MFQDYRNTEAFRQWCLHEKRMGFTAKACMGPAQVEIANEVFDTDREEIRRAGEIKALFESHAARGIHGFMSESYGFIDEPIYRDALIVLKNRL
jgi:citrate lyase subunit beta/citryl-CoA lyase